MPPSESQRNIANTTIGTDAVNALPPNSSAGAVGVAPEAEDTYEDDSSSSSSSSGQSTPPQARGGSLPRRMEGGSIDDASVVFSPSRGAPLGTNCEHYFAEKSQSMKALVAMCIGLVNDQNKPHQPSGGAMERSE